MSRTDSQRERIGVKGEWMRTYIAANWLNSWTSHLERVLYIGVVIVAAEKDGTVVIMR